MGKLTNVHTARIGVWDQEKLVRIAPSHSVEVVRDFTGHPMVKAELLRFEAGEPAGDDKGGKADLVTVTDITGEDGVFTVQASDGVVFSLARNQVREDGTLTGGGLKAYEEAKGKSESQEGGKENAE